MSKQKYDVRTISISEIRENPVALRAVDRDSEEYIGLRDSIATKGLLNPISVRERTEDVDGTVVAYYELVDGLHRYAACCEVGLPEIPVNVRSLSDADVLEAQIMANVHKIDTKPVQYTKQLNRIFAGNPTMTVADMAAKLCKSPAWVSQRLGLLKLDTSVGDLVDDGKISISNAVALSKLPRDEQVNFIDQAMTMASDEFAPTVQARAKELRDAKRQGRSADTPTFTPVARLQKLGELKAEVENPSVGPQLVKQQGVKDAASGFALGVAWAINLDPASIEIQRAKIEEKQRSLDEAKKKRAADRAKKKAEEAAVAAAKAAEEAAGVTA